MSIKFQCIAPFKGGDQVHNRLLLTDVGGASIPYGTQELGSSFFDDMSLLYGDQYRTRWPQHGKAGGPRVIGDTVRIQGELG